MGFIYRISSAVGKVDYYGSTSRDIFTRFDEHKEGYSIWDAHQSLTIYSDGQMTRSKGKFVTSYKVLKYSDAKVEMVEDCPTVDLIEREKHYIRANPCVNMVYKDPRHYHGYNRPA